MVFWSFAGMGAVFVALGLLALLTARSTRQGVVPQGNGVSARVLTKTAIGLQQIVLFDTPGGPIKVYMHSLTAADLVEGDEGQLFTKEFLGYTTLLAFKSKGQHRIIVPASPQFKTVAVVFLTLGVFLIAGGTALQTFVIPSDPRTKIKVTSAQAKSPLELVRDGESGKLVQLKVTIQRLPDRISTAIEQDLQVKGITLRDPKEFTVTDEHIAARCVAAGNVVNAANLKPGAHVILDARLERTDTSFWYLLAEFVHPE